MKKCRWNLGRNFNKKREVAELLAESFPDCRGRSVVMTPSTTCFDIEAMRKCGKMNSKTLLYGFEHLRSSCFEPRMKSAYRHVLSSNPYWVGKRVVNDFLLEFKNRLHEIFGTDGFYESARKRIVFGNILESNLNIEFERVAYGSGFKLIYADLCGVFNSRLLTWLCWNSTIGSLSSDGKLAFTVILNRWKQESVELASDQSCLRHPCEISFLGEYSKECDADYYLRKMNGIANCVENRSGRRLEVERMIHYCECDRHSQMVTVVCRKLK